MNIIYFNPDEMRADVLGCYGHPLVQTPNFDRFARESVRFDNCHVQHTVCTPSRCSFMTGWYPHVNGHRTLWNCLRPDEPNTMKYLKKHGYDVHWIGKNDLLSPESFDDSVTEVHKWKSMGAHKNERMWNSVEDPRYMDFLYKPMDGHNFDYYNMDTAIEFLKNRQPEAPPFMLFLAFGFPHCPYTVPQPWYDMYDPDDIPPLRSEHLENLPEFHHWIRKYRRLDEVDEKEFRKIMAVYLGMVSYVDYIFGRLLDTLEDTGLAKDTALLFFSDHGDWAGDYGLVEKWPSGLDDCLTRIPMIVRTPDCQPGHVVNEPVECFDIMPTTLELAGVEVQHTHFAQSMLPQLKGASGNPNRAVFAEGGYDPHEPHCFEGNHDSLTGNPEGIYYPKALQQQEHPETVCRSTMIRTSTHKLVRRPNGTSELYDMLNDPFESDNCYGQEEYQAIQQQLEKQMLDWYIHTADVVPFESNPRGFPMEVHP